MDLHSSNYVIQGSTVYIDIAIDNEIDIDTDISTDIDIVILTKYEPKATKNYERVVNIFKFIDVLFSHNVF